MRDNNETREMRVSSGKDRKVNEKIGRREKVKHAKKKLPKISTP